MLSSQGPVHSGAEVEDVGFWSEGFASDLFRRDVVGCTLNPAFCRSDSAALTQVDYPYITVFGDKNVVNRFGDRCYLRMYRTASR